MAEPKFRKVAFADMFKIRDWLNANWAIINDTRPNYIDVCVQIKAAIDVELTPASLKTIVKAAGFTWPRAYRKTKMRGGHSTSTSRRLAGYIAILFDSLDEPRPAGLSEMISGRVFDAESNAREE